MGTRFANSRLWGVRAIIVLLVSLMIAGLVMLWNAGFFDGGGWLWPVLGLMLLVGLIPLFGLAGKHRHKGISVLWCRRFSKANLVVGDRNRWIWAVITKACQGLAVPITLRDRSLAGSQSVGRSLQPPLSILLIVIATPLWLMGMLRALDFVDGSLPEFAVCVAGLAVYIFMFKLIGNLTVFVTSTVATHEGDPDALRKRVSAIKNQRWNRRELDAIRCTDENWQACVTAVLEAVDFVIIDNVDSSENIDWEIQQSIEHVGTERVLMLLRQSSEAWPGVTSVFFDFEKADSEIEQLKSMWGEDDFGESVQIGEAGEELASILREKLQKGC